MAMKTTQVSATVRRSFMKARTTLRELKNHQHLNSLLVHTGQHHDKHVGRFF